MIKKQLTAELIKKIMEDPEFPPNVDRYQLQQLAEYGHTDEYMAAFFGVGDDTWNNWKRLYPEFYQALQFWKNFADEEVERALFERARGYDVDEEKVFCNGYGDVTKVRTKRHYPPDVKAATQWLNNRKPEEWKDKQTVAVEGDKELADMVIKANQRLRKAKQKDIGAMTDEEEDLLS